MGIEEKFDDYKKELTRIEGAYQKQESYLKTKFVEYKSEKDLHKKLEILNLFVNIPKEIYEALKDNLNKYIILRDNKQKLEKINTKITTPIKNLEKELELKFSSEFNFKYDTTNKAEISGHIFLGKYISPLINIEVNFNTKDIYLKIEDDIDLIEDLKETNKDLIKKVEDMTKLDINDIMGECFWKDVKLIKELDDTETGLIKDIEDIASSFNKEVNEDIKKAKEEMKEAVDYLDKLQRVSLDINDILFNFAIKHRFLLSSNVSYPVPENQLKLFDSNMIIQMA